MCVYINLFRERDRYDIIMQSCLISQNHLKNPCILTGPPWCCWTLMLKSPVRVSLSGASLTSP